MSDHRELVEIDYTNWRGERRTRIVRMIMMEAIDDDGEVKMFAIENIHAWKPHKASHQQGEPK